MSPEEFKEARRALGLTQSELGAVLDTAPQTIRKWEMSDVRSTARGVNPVAARAMRWFLGGFRPPEWPRRPVG
ncbi:helix-turn-helix domain-containing protein [uncultured Zoogloea sp.]|uniref:helix-turn-helix domain-containing protein n=1 Tax=uncultured Zoogloea sp. TaxID=160237 RepID=UPI0026303EA9|nr:helix-turn-helix domain-containing protein [uncultured Zoogloea sp.]